MFLKEKKEMDESREHGKCNAAAGNGEEVRKRGTHATPEGRTAGIEPGGRHQK
jgi:hypothetical protein